MDHDRRRDARTAAITFMAGLLLIALGLNNLWAGATRWAGGSDWWFALPFSVACVALLFKRVAPARSLLVGLLALCADALLGGSVAILLPFFDLLYTTALRSSARVRNVLWVGGGVLVAVPVALRLAETGNLQFAVLTGLQQAAIFLCPLWWAMDVRRKSELAELAAARASAVERLSGARRQEAVRAERDSLARDLHDVVASHLSAIALHSGGALATPPETDKDRAALEQVRRSALESMEDMKAMITLLRSPEASGSNAAVSQQRLSDLKPLLHTAQVNGLTVNQIDQNVGECGPLSPGTELVGYRIVQEALTNAAKHAPGSEVVVSTRQVGDRVRIVVRNALTERTHSSADGLGLGLTSMRERARSIGGSVRAGAAAGSWTVTADLPTVAASVEVSA